jgi:hypothetical protein
MVMANCAAAPAPSHSPCLKDESLLQSGAGKSSDFGSPFSPPINSAAQY